MLTEPLPAHVFLLASVVSGDRVAFAAPIPRSRPARGFKFALIKGTKTMFFHVDEAGNTGNNLFDSNQPQLSYGVLSSLTNVDARCHLLQKRILRQIAKEQIHAKELGIKGLNEIAPTLMQIQRIMKFDFDYFFIHKPSFALVTFFDAVFDAGLNKAVKWDTYWSPFRYLIIAKLAPCFDEALLRESWRLCTVKNIDRHETAITVLLQELKARAARAVVDQRAQEIIIDALDFGIKNPMELDFGFPEQKMLSPNAVGFQFVAAAVARRVKKKGRQTASSIIVDRQTQFNESQQLTQLHQGRITESIRTAPQHEKNRHLMHPMFVTFKHDEIVHRGLPDKPLTIARSIDSIGLQLVDVYLWLANKILSGTTLPPQLFKLWSMFSDRSVADGISTAGMMSRFAQFEKLLPPLEGLTEAQKDFAQAAVDEHRAKVRRLRSQQTPE